MAKQSRWQEATLRLFWAVCGGLPRRWANALGAAILGGLGPLTPRQKKLEGNFAAIFPETSKAEIGRMTRAAWREFGRTLSEYPFMRRVYALGPENNPHYGFDIHPEVAAIAAASQPAIYVGAHISNWEFAAIGARLKGVPLTIVYATLAGGFVDAAIRRAREEIGCGLITRADGMRPLIKCMQEGGSLAILIDRRLKAGPTTEFFGRQIAFSQAPAKLAMKFGCPIVPQFVSRADDGRVIVHAKAPIWPDRMPGDVRERATVITRRLAEVLEEEIRARPGDWFCGQRLWPEPRRRQAKRRALLRFDA